MIPQPRGGDGVAEIQAILDDPEAPLTPGARRPSWLRRLPHLVPAALGRLDADGGVQEVAEELEAVDEARAGA